MLRIVCFMLCDFYGNKKKKLINLCLSEKGVKGNPKKRKISAELRKELFKSGFEREHMQEEEAPP